MSDADSRYTAQSTKRMVARVVGVVCMSIALLLIGLAVADFISAFNSETDDHPSMFWMFFLAVPFFLAGGVGLNAGFLGAGARYAAAEVGPTLQATFDSSQPDHQGETCEHCGARSAAGSAFCDNCGEPLRSTCASCKHPNATAAKYCAACGTPLG